MAAVPLSAIAAALADRIRTTPADPDRLAAVANALAARVGDYGTDDNLEWLLEQLPDPADWLRLNFVLAAAHPVNRIGWDTLVDWARRGETRPVDEAALPAAARRILDRPVPRCPVDPVAVDRTCTGEAGAAGLNLNRAERAEVATRLTAAGAQPAEIGAVLGINRASAWRLKHRRLTAAKETAA
jgi:hypothetical protein